MLTHRGTLKRLTETTTDGVPTGIQWSTVKENVHCKIDTTFSRRGKDPMWTPEAGRKVDRMGVGFFYADEDVRPGDRIIMTHGPTGTFELDGAWDTPTDRRGDPHHHEVGVTEVAQGQGT